MDKLSKFFDFQFISSKRVSIWTLFFWSTSLKQWGRHFTKRKATLQLNNANITQSSKYILSLMLLTKYWIVTGFILFEIFINRSGKHKECTLNLYELYVFYGHFLVWEKEVSPSIKCFSFQWQITARWHKEDTKIWRYYDCILNWVIKPYKITPAHLH